MSELITNPLGISEVATVTLQRVRPKIADNIYRSVALWARLKERNRLTMADGGESWVTPILTRKTSNVRDFVGYEELDITPQDNVRSAVWDWKQKGGTVAISGREEAINAGSAKILSVLQSRFEQEGMGMIDSLNTDAQARNAGNAKKIFGLGDMIEANAQGSQTTTVGGVAKSATNADGVRFWENVYDNVTSSTRGANSADGNTFQDTGLVGMHYVYLTCSQGVDQVDLVLTNISGYLNYEQSLQPQQRYAVAAERQIGNAKFPGLKFGQADVFFDIACPTNRMYFLNTRWLECAVLRNLEVSDPKSPVNGDGKYWGVQWMGAFACYNMFRQGILVGTDNF